MADTPLGRARQALLDAKRTAERNPSGANLKAVEDARAHLDYLLDVLPHPRTPDGPGASSPGPSVSSLEDELLAMGHEQ